MPPHRRALTRASALVGCLALLQSAVAQTCQSQSAARPIAVVELFTSQGCSSCPPADQWLSTLKTRKDVIALSFHVNYWNYLGWKDPYATPETTERQKRIQRAIHGNYVYTPQVILNGQDFRDWRGSPGTTLAHLPTATAPALSLARRGSVVTAQVGALDGVAPVAGYWAVLHDDLSQQVTRGENAGARLVNDHVVTLYQPVPGWNGQTAHTEQLTLPAGQTSARVVFVVTDAGLTRPLQGLALQCAEEPARRRAS